MRILVAEDDTGVAGFIRRGLKEQQFAVDVVPDGEDALHLAQSQVYDAIVLDWLLPGRNGLDVLRALREAGNTAPVLILTAKGELENKVAGLNAGADDYLTKPFHFEEFLARLRALLRRQGPTTPTVLRFGDLEVDQLRHEVSRGGKKLELTTREYEVLEFLMRHAGSIVTRTMLMEHVWEYHFDPLSNVIDVHISRLRNKIDGDFPLKLLHTIRGSGYILRLPEGNGGDSKPDRQARPDKS